MEGPLYYWLHFDRSEAKGNVCGFALAKWLLTSLEKVDAIREGNGVLVRGGSLRCLPSRCSGQKLSEGTSFWESDIAPLLLPPPGSGHQSYFLCSDEPQTLF